MYPAIPGLGAGREDATYRAFQGREGDAEEINVDGWGKGRVENLSCRYFLREQTAFVASRVRHCTGIEGKTAC